MESSGSEKKIYRASTTAPVNIAVIKSAENPSHFTLHDLGR